MSKPVSGPAQRKARAKLLQRVDELEVRLARLEHDRCARAVTMERIGG